MAKMRTTNAAEPKAESMPMRMPLPVEPPSLLLLMLMTMLVSWGASSHVERESLADGVDLVYDVSILTVSCYRGVDMEMR